MPGEVPLMQSLAHQSENLLTLEQTFADMRPFWREELLRDGRDRSDSRHGPCPPPAVRVT